MANDFYQVLGIAPDAPHQHIVQRYHLLLREARVALAADKAMPLERLDAIRIAYRTLSDPRERERYDAKLARSRAQAAARSTMLEPRKAVPALLALVAAAGAAWSGLHWVSPPASVVLQRVSAQSSHAERSLPPSIALAHQPVLQPVPLAAAARTTVAAFEPLSAAAGDPPLYVAASTGDVAGIERALGEGADLHAKGRFGTALHVAIANGHDRVAALLLERGASVSVARSSTGARALHVLAQVQQVQPGHRRILPLLLKYSADPEARDAQGNTALVGFMNERARALEYVQTLVAHYPNKSWWGLSQAPMLAAANAREAIEYLLDQGYHVDQPDEQGATLLHYAGHSDDVSLTRLLLANNAKVNERSNAGLTPLHYARRADQIAALVAAGADVNARDRAQRTPLHGVNVLHVDAVAQLLSASADVNAADEHGDAPLHLAVNYGSVGKIRLLLRAGANPQLPNRAGLTPAMLADARDYAPVVEVLAAAK